MANLLNRDEAHELERCELVIKQGLETFIEVGQALMIVRDKRLYRVEFSTFEDYCQTKWALPRRSVNRYIAASQTVHELGPMGPKPETERQARPLTGLEPEIQRLAWSEVLETSNGARITAKVVEEVAETWKPYNQELKAAKLASEPDFFNQQPIAIADVVEEIADRKKAHVSNNGGNNEWYTPACYIESARLVMGGIDLDPATSEIANKTVQAGLFFTEKDNGLAQEWFGNVWMNPPYAQPLIQDFCEKLIQEDIRQAIVLVNNASETKWGNMLLSNCAAVCFPKGRIRFVAPNGTLGDSPLQGQMIVYFGAAVERFCNEFKMYGVCLKA